LVNKFDKSGTIVPLFTSEKSLKQPETHGLRLTTIYPYLCTP